MRRHRDGFAWLGRRLVAAVILLAVVAPAPVAAQSIQDILAAVVRIKTTVASDARTADTLGREREGSGIVIDQAGLVVTIGYLMVEADGAEITGSDGRTVPAQIIGYDHESGFGLLRAMSPLNVRPIPLGRSADTAAHDPVLIASYGGSDMAAPAFVVAKRTFAGSWEYLLDDAIFTAPPHPAWSGAALLDRNGSLIGVGSLIVGDATGTGAHFPGNMFVPIDHLKPILGDLLAAGRRAEPGKPWLGVNTEEVRGRLIVTRVVPDSPAERAGIRAGDLIVGVAGEAPQNLADFYRKVWQLGDAGVTVPLNLLQGAQLRNVEVKSMDRRDHLRLKRSY